MISYRIISYITCTFMLLLCAIQVEIEEATPSEKTIDINDDGDYIKSYYNLKIPSMYPAYYIPVALDNVIASYIPLWPEYTLNENIYSFATSMGAKALHDQFDRGNKEDTFLTILQRLKDTCTALNTSKFISTPSSLTTLTNEKSYENHNANQYKPHVVTPMLIDGAAALSLHPYTQFQNDDDHIKNTAKTFLKKHLQLTDTNPSNINNNNNNNNKKKEDGDTKSSSSSPALDHFLHLLSSQIKLAKNRQTSSKLIFENAMQKKNIVNLKPTVGAPSTLDNIVKDSNQRILNYKKQDNYDRKTLKKDDVKQIQHGMTIVGKYMLSNNRLDIFVINLMSSPYRRMYIQSELKRAGMDFKYIHYMPAVDGMMVPLEDLKEVLVDSRDTIIHQGAIGCSLSHISIWRDIVKLGLPYALVLEDDAVILPNAKEHINVGINAIYDTIGNDWDVIVTDFGSSPYVGMESLRQHGVPHDCIHAFYNTSGGLFVDITGTPCAHINSVSYIVSYQGAKKMLQHLIPFELPIDVEMLRLVEKGILRTFVLLPFVSGQLFQESKSGTDMIERFMTMENGEAKYTFKSMKERSCINERCVLRVYSKRQK